MAPTDVFCDSRSMVLKNLLLANVSFAAVYLTFLSPCVNLGTLVYILLLRTAHTCGLYTLPEQIGCFMYCQCLQRLKVHKNSSLIILFAPSELLA